MDIRFKDNLFMVRCLEHDTYFFDDEDCDYCVELDLKRIRFIQERGQKTMGVEEIRRFLNGED